MPEDVEPNDTCPYCDEPLQTPPEGTTIRCDRCGNFIMIDAYTGSPRVAMYNSWLPTPLLVAHWLRRQWKRRGFGRL
jgi:hypothetical protein